MKPANVFCLCVVIGAVAFAAGWLGAGFGSRRVAKAESSAVMPKMDVRGHLPASARSDRVWLLEQANGGRDVLILDRKTPPAEGEVWVNGRPVESFKVGDTTVRVFVDCVEAAP